MASYSVFEPPSRADAADTAPERFRLVRDRFCLAAFFFGPLWMIYRRLWLVLVCYAVLLALLAVTFRYLNVSTEVVIAVFALLALLVGLEAPSLRRWTYLRRGWRERGVVVADDVETAERRFFDLWIEAGIDAPAREPLHETARAPSPPPGSYAQEVIGLFPKPEGAR
ncbi:MAG: DUF2628 domain-containing protein [Proteobacteria bacterium]|nr:DUF2628 domain-containing protein [Pseudomonadota bacterium]